MNTQPLTPAALRGIKAYLGISALVFLLMMLAGLVMRLMQAQWLPESGFFYRLMTAHGVGMVGISGLAASAVLWYFLKREVDLSTTVLYVNLGFFLAGVIGILGGIFVGGFAGAWTFLYPLPAHGLGAWGVAGASAYLIGLLLVGVGFLLFYLDVARAILTRFGSLGRALGWPQLFLKSSDPMPPPAVVAATMVLVINIAGIVVGAVVLVLMLINLFVPSFAVDALLTKNLIYFFGHVFINATIYQAVVAVYGILSQASGRPWNVNRVFLAAWTAAMIMVMAVYPHHLLMDFAMPTWALVLGQILSYTSGFPILLVTAYGALTIVFRSGIRWSMASGLVFLGVFGWAAGVLPAIIDGTIAVNNVMHNTMWVPGHFHFYLVLGLVAMLFGFMYYVIGDSATGDSAARDGLRNNGVDRAAFWLYLAGGLGFALALLASGRDSVPRRWAVHYPEWLPLDRIGSVFAALIVLAAFVFVARFLLNLSRPVAESS
jgi:cytochrome c oxidase subunit 1